LSGKGQWRFSKWSKNGGFLAFFKSRILMFSCKNFVAGTTQQHFKANFSKIFACGARHRVLYNISAHLWPALLTYIKYSPAAPIILILEHNFEKDIVAHFGRYVIKVGQKRLLILFL